jgi:hypothetical protein
MYLYLIMQKNLFYQQQCIQHCFYDFNLFNPPGHKALLPLRHFILNYHAMLITCETYALNTFPFSARKLIFAVKLDLDVKYPWTFTDVTFFPVTNLVCKYR